MFTQLKGLLGRQINKAGLKGEIQALEVLRSFKKFADGEGWYPRTFKDGVLKVEAGSSGWAQKLHVGRVRIIELINEDIGRKVVKKIDIKIM